MLIMGRNHEGNLDSMEEKVMQTVYLAGPINGCTDAEASDWREAIKALLNCNFLDPMVRDYRGREMECVNEIVELDKKDIDNSTHIVVMFDKPSVGTAMEVLYAWERGKPIIVIAKEGTKLSPWLIYHSTAVVFSLRDAVHMLEIT